MAPVINNIVSRINNYIDRVIALSAPSDELTPIIKRKLIIIYALYTFGTLYLLSFSIIALKANAYTIFFSDIAIVCIFTFGLVWLHYTGGYFPIAFIGSMSSGLLFLYLFMIGSFNNTGHMWSYIFPLFTISILGPHVGLSAVSLYLVGIIYIYLYGDNYDFMYQQSASFMVRFIPTYVLLVGFMYLYEISVSRNLMEISKVTKELKNSHSQLEERVKERTTDLNAELKERKLTEKKLENSERVFRSIFEHAGDYALILEPNVKGLTIVDMSQSGCKMHGYTRDQLVGQPISLIDVGMQPEQYQFVHRKKQQIRDEITFETVHRRKNGSTFPVKVNSKLIEMDGRKLFFSIEHDITEKKQIELQRKQIETIALSQANLTSLGEIATGIAHEMNQPLSYIQVIYESTLRDIRRGEVNLEEIKSDFTEALYQVKRITTIIDHLRVFGRSDRSVFETVNLKDVLEKSLILMNEKLKHRNILLVTSLSDNLQPVFGNYQQMEQVFINLFQNTFDVMENVGKGVIRIIMRNAPDGKVKILFSDNGSGIPEEHRTRIFEPFFTTKEIGKGTGIGLSIVFGIINDHKGIITCHSHAGIGTSFKIILPAHRET